MHAHEQFRITVMATYFMVYKAFLHMFVISKLLAPPSTL